MKTFRQKVLNLITVPVERVAFRKDKWGTICTVYFHGKFRPVTIADDTISNDDIKAFLHYVKHGSEAMVEEAEKTYGKNWRKYIKHRC